MKTYQHWIWQQEDWPDFHYVLKVLLPKLTSLSRLIGEIEATCRTLTADVKLNAQAHVMADDAIETSMIEGEILRRSSVRASIRKKLGLSVEKDDSNNQTDGLVAMLMDARESSGQLLTEDKLFAWHAALFPTGYSGLHKIHVGRYRGSEEMQIVSGPEGKQLIHYIAPPANILTDEMHQFLNWVNATGNADSILKAGIAHLWFIMIHPFDDGNGRIARAVSDFLMSKSSPPLMQLISFSKHVSLNKKEYYHKLENAGKGTTEITEWLIWFLETLTEAIKDSRWVIDQAIKKARFWEKNRDTLINDRQRKMLNRLLDAGSKFEGGMTTRKYAGMTKCSKVTASRDLADLESKGILQKRPGRGRSTCYEVPDF